MFAGGTIWILTHGHLPSCLPTSPGLVPHLRGDLGRRADAAGPQSQGERRLRQGHGGGGESEKPRGVFLFLCVCVVFFCVGLLVSWFVCLFD